jgi:hypothetical protein
VLLGNALFGVAGALLAVPVSAMLLALFELRVTPYALLPQADDARGHPGTDSPADADLAEEGEPPVPPSDDPTRVGAIDP